MRSIICISWTLTTTDQEHDTPAMGFSRSFRIMKERSAVLNAMRTASIPAGINSDNVWEVLIAAAANEPVQSPKR
jgi:hypothetical protein